MSLRIQTASPTPVSDGLIAPYMYLLIANAPSALPAGPVMKYPVKTNTKEADSPQA